MRYVRILVAAAFAVATSTAYAANLDSGVQSATKFCLTYLQTGKQSDILARDGFEPKGNGVEKSFGRNILLGHKNNVHVSVGKKQNQLLCLVSIGNEGNKARHEFQQTAYETATAQGFRPTTATDVKGRKIEVLKKSGTAVSVASKSTSASAASALC